MYKLILIFFFIVINLNAIEKLKVGVLAYGTVNWGLDVLKHHNLDRKNGFELEVVKLASKNAQLIALQGGDVDIIVNDWIWVNKQRARGKDYTLYPYSKALGTLMVNRNSNFKTLQDLTGVELGVAGGQYDKTWILLKTYYKSKYKKDLEKEAKPVFASPPILYKKMLDKSLSASINFWHFNGKLKAKDFTPLIEIEDILRDLGVDRDITFVGWVFNREFAQKKQTLVNGFLNASLQSKHILKDDEKEWDRIRPLLKAKDPKTFASLKKDYKAGIIEKFTEKDIDELEKVYKILLSEGGENYIKKDTPFDRKSFWLK